MRIIHSAIQTCFVRSVFGLAVVILALEQGVPAGAQQVRSKAFPSVNEPSPGALTNVLAQIAALEIELTNRTQVQMKIYPSLLEALREHRGTPPRAAIPKLRSGINLLPGARVLVDIKANVTPSVLTNIRQNGGTIISSFPGDKYIRAEIPVESLESLASLADVFKIRPGALPQCNVGSATSEGYVAHAVDSVFSTYGVTGAGVKVGVLSDSDKFLANSQSAGDLGPVTALPGQDGTNFPNAEGEGTAMMEIVHDLAPGAQLFFASGDGGPSQMASNIMSMATNYGCQIIIDDISYFDESPFHENLPVSQAVKAVSDMGVLYFSSAANNGGEDSHTSGTWEGDFNPSSATLSQIPGTLHDWGGGTVFNLVTNTHNTGSSYIALFWNDPWGAASSQYNIYETDKSGNILMAGVDSPANLVQADSPFAITPSGATNGNYIVVSRTAGSGPNMIFATVGRDGLGFSTPGATLGHNSASAANAFSVAGVVAQGVTQSFPTVANNSFYTLSSDGPRRIFYDTSGAAITPGNLTSSGGLVLQKPDITAATGVQASTTFGPPGPNNPFDPFYGTSAAAPHAGAIAALLLSYRPDLTPAQVRAAFNYSAFQLSGFQARDQGVGVVMADKAIAYLNPTVNFVYPTNGEVLSDSPVQSILGYADDNTATLGSVRVGLSRGTDGAWYDFVHRQWGSTTFDFNNDVLVATGTTGWVAQMPALPNGAYTVTAQSVDEYSHASPWTNITITLNVPALTVDFAPLTNTATVFDLTQLSGTINRAATVEFRLEQYDSSGNNDLYWNGSTWIANGNDPSVYFAATVTGTNWAPASGATLPTRGQTRAGLYLLRAIAQDNGGNSVTNDMFVSRSSPDTTPPVLTLNTIHNNDVFTNRSMPALTGFAEDPESGVASVTVYLNQFLPGGPYYWTGSSWSATPSTLTLTYNPQTVTWQATSPLPSGSNLPNAGYQVQVSANNNEVPSGNNTLSVNFSINYHPIFVFNNAGGDGLWANPANWNMNQVPTADAVAIIEGSTVDNTSLGSLNIYGLVLDGTLTTAGMTVTNLNVIDGTLDGGIINIPANGVFTWSSGILTGAYTVSAGANAYFTNSADKNLNYASLVNNGTVTWSAGNLYGSVQSAITNNGSFIIQGSDELDNNGVGYGDLPYPVFVNNGLLQKTVSSGDTVLATDYQGWIFYQNGTFDIESGALSSRNTLIVNPGSIFEGAGETRMDGGSITINGTNSLQTGATFEIASGVLYGTNTFAGAGTVIWSGGIIDSALSLRSNVVLNITSDSDKTLGDGGALGYVKSFGQATWTGAGRVECGAGSVLENDGAFIDQNDSAFLNSAVNYGAGYAVPTFINNGTFIKTNSTGQTLFDLASNYGGVAFNNNGTVAIQSGSLALGGGGTELNSTFAVTAGSVMDFTNGTFTFSGRQSLQGGGTNRVSGASITFNSGTNTLSNGNSFELAAGTLLGTNTVSGAGAWTWSGGTIDGTLALQSGIALNITGANDKTLGETGALPYFKSTGPGTWTGTGRINCSVGSLFENDGTFTVQNDSAFLNNAGNYGSIGYAPPTFINNGTFIKTNSTGQTLFDLSSNYGGVAFNNNGTVAIQSGSLALGGGGAELNSTFAVAAGSVIDFTNGAFTFGGTQSLQGSGINRVGGASITFNSSTNALSNGNSFELAAGTLLGTNTVSGAGAWTWSGGTIDGTLALQPSIALNITGASDKTLGNGNTFPYFKSSGPATWTGTGHINCCVGSLFENDGVFTVQNDSAFLNNGANYGSTNLVPTFVNNGTFIKTNSTGQTLFDLSSNYGGVAFTNNGTVDLCSGTLAISGPSGVSATNKLNVTIGGPAPGTQFGNETNASTASFAGTLAISLANGFTPTNGQSFAIATYGSETGQFAVTQLPVLSASSQWVVVYNPTSLVLEVISGNVFQNPGTVAGYFQFTFTGQSGSRCIIDASTNLLTWTSLVTNAPFNGTLNYTDLQSAQLSQRFYRATIYP